LIEGLFRRRTTFAYRVLDYNWDVEVMAAVLGHCLEYKWKSELVEGCDAPKQLLLDSRNAYSILRKVRDGTGEDFVSLEEEEEEYDIISATSG
jgi:hypothetical protein